MLPAHVVGDASHPRLTDPLLEHWLARTRERHLEERYVRELLEVYERARPSYLGET